MTNGVVYQETRPMTGADGLITDHVELRIYRVVMAEGEHFERLMVLYNPTGARVGAYMTEHGPDVTEAEAIECAETLFTVLADISRILYRSGTSSAAPAMLAA